MSPVVVHEGAPAAAWLLVVVAFLLELIAAIMIGFAVTAVPPLALVAGGLAAGFLAKLV